MDKVIGRKISQETSTIYENGLWTSNSKIVESRLKDDGEEWQTAELESTAIDRTFELAYGAALDSVLKEFLSRTIGRGFDSLLDANEYDNKKELVERTIDGSKDKSN